MLRELFYEAIKHIDFTVIEGHRGKAEQNRLFELGKSRVKWPGSSHNYIPSKAIDIAPYYIEKPHVRYDKTALWRWYYFGGYIISLARSMSIPIRWGGDWDMDTYVLDQTFNDLPHFELSVVKGKEK